MPILAQPNQNCTKKGQTAPGEIILKSETAFLKHLLDHSEVISVPKLTNVTQQNWFRLKK